jgi:hypothetical protein
MFVALLSFGCSPSGPVHSGASKCLPAEFEACATATRSVTARSHAPKPMPLFSAARCCTQGESPFGRAGLVCSALSRQQFARHAPSQFVVGASRRSAAPGSQFVGAAEYGSFYVSLCRQAGAIGSRWSRPYRLAPSVARHPAMPNPSIERTCPGKPGQASHVKR